MVLVNVIFVLDEVEVFVIGDEVIGIKIVKVVLEVLVC